MTIVYIVLIVAALAVIAPIVMFLNEWRFNPSDVAGSAARFVFICSIVICIIATATFSLAELFW